LAEFQVQELYWIHLDAFQKIPHGPQIFVMAGSGEVAKPAPDVRIKSQLLQVFVAYCVFSLQHSDSIQDFFESGFVNVYVANARKSVAFAKTGYSIITQKESLLVSAASGRKKEKERGVRLAEKKSEGDVTTLKVCRARLRAPLF
jgi:hypothetical protein